MKFLLLFSIALSFTAACQQSSLSPTDSNEPGERSLALTNDVELGVLVIKGGQPLGDVSGFSLKLIPKSGFGVYHKGHKDSLTVSRSSSNINVPLSTCPTVNCVNGPLQDGFNPETQSGYPKVWNGVYTVELTTPTGQKCTEDVAMNHVHDATISGNGSLFDQMAGDQKVWISVTSSDNCLGADSITSSFGVHPIPNNPLVASISSSSTDWGLPGDTFDFIADPSGGLGNNQYAWKFWIENPSGQYTDWTAFTSQTTYSRTFSEEGDVCAILLVRDGNDSFGNGGQYSLTDIPDWHCFAVEEPIAHNSMAMGNSLPGTVWGTVWYATSVTMKNTGTETWSGSSFTLDQMPSQIWNPSNTGLGSASIESGEMHTFYYNMVTYSSNEGYYDNYWKMKNGTMFGQDNGRSTYNKGIHPDSSLASTGQWLSKMLALMSPNELFAAGHWDQSDIVQVLRKEQFPIDAAKVQADGRYVLRYVASLDEDWDIDFSLRVEFNPQQFSVGSLIKGAGSETHDVRARMTGPGELLVEGTRFSSNIGLVGRGTIFELPLELKDNAQAPSSLPLVELIAYE